MIRHVMNAHIIAQLANLLKISVILVYLDIIKLRNLIVFKQIAQIQLIGNFIQKKLINF